MLLGVSKMLTRTGVPELEQAIQEYVEENKNPKPFVWTATTEQILDKVRRCKVILETLH